MTRRLWLWVRTPVTVCAWCQPKRTIIRFGNPFVPTSHGMCPTCAKGWDRSVAVFHAMRRTTEGR